MPCIIRWVFPRMGTADFFGISEGDSFHAFPPETGPGKEIYAENGRCAGRRCFPAPAVPAEPEPEANGLQKGAGSRFIPPDGVKGVSAAAADPSEKLSAGSAGGCVFRENASCAAPVLEFCTENEAFGGRMKAAADRFTSDRTAQPFR